MNATTQTNPAAHIAEGTIYCRTCGMDSRVCPACAGAGEVTLSRSLDPQEDYTVRCSHCRGTGRHFCEPCRCDCGCARLATRWHAGEDLRLCDECAAEASREEVRQ